MLPQMPSNADRKTTRPAPMQTYRLVCTKLKMSSKYAGRCANSIELAWMFTLERPRNWTAPVVLLMAKLSSSLSSSFFKLEEGVSFVDWSLKGFVANCKARGFSVTSKVDTTAASLGKLSESIACSNSFFIRWFKVLTVGAASVGRSDPIATSSGTSSRSWVVCTATKAGNDDFT